MPAQIVFFVYRFIECYSGLSQCQVVGIEQMKFMQNIYDEGHVKILPIKIQIMNVLP